MANDRVLGAPTARRLFDRLDTDRSNDIDRQEIGAYLKELGFGGGLLGGAKISKGVDGFMSKFDTDPVDGKVTWDEFVKNGKHLLPPGLTGPGGGLDREKVAQVFEQIARGQAKATAADVAQYIQPQLRGAAAMFASTIAEGAGKIAVDALDSDGDDAFTRDDLAHLLDDINAQLRNA